jgi:hypothetical protein
VTNDDERERPWTAVHDAIARIPGWAIARIPQLLGPKGTRNGLAEHETGFGPGYTSRHD